MWLKAVKNKFLKGAAKIKTGTVRVSPDLFMRGHAFPDNWLLLSLKMESMNDDIIAVFEGDDFPEVEKGQLPKLCRVNIHRKEIVHEVIEVI